MNWFQWILVIATGTCLGVLGSNLALALVITLKQRKLRDLAEEFAQREAGEVEWDAPYFENTARGPRDAT